jgi:hypothetical protein
MIEPLLILNIQDSRSIRNMELMRSVYMYI